MTCSKCNGTGKIKTPLEDMHSKAYYGDEIPCPGCGGIPAKPLMGDPFVAGQIMQGEIARKIFEHGPCTMLDFYREFIFHKRLQEEFVKFANSRAPRFEKEPK